MVDSNGWSQYEKLVMKSLGDLADGLKETRSEVARLTTSVAIIQKSIRDYNEIEDRIVNLEAHVVTDDKMRTERRWLFGAIIAIAGSILFPTLIVATNTGLI